MVCQLFCTNLQDPVIRAFCVKNIKASVGGEPDQAVGQDMPVTDTNPGYLEKEEKQCQKNETMYFLICFSI